MTTDFEANLLFLGRKRKIRHPLLFNNDIKSSLGGSIHNPDEIPAIKRKRKLKDTDIQSKKFKKQIVGSNQVQHLGTLYDIF